MWITLNLYELVGSNRTFRRALADLMTASYSPPKSKAAGGLKGQLHAEVFRILFCASSCSSSICNCLPVPIKIAPQSEYSSTSVEMPLRAIKRQKVTRKASVDNSITFTENESVRCVILLLTVRVRWSTVETAARRIMADPV